MSKAFTKDDGAEAPLVVQRAPLPSGVLNYVTPTGLAALRGELAELSNRLRGAAAEPSTEQADLAALRVRLAELEGRVACAVLVDPLSQPRDTVRFGAKVSVRASSGNARSYRIVGVDEAKANEGRIAFTSPLAQALLGKGCGDLLIVRTPQGEEEFEVLTIDYAAP